MAGLYCRYTSAPFSFPFFFGWVRRDWRKLFPGLVIFFPHSAKYDQNSWPENENSVVIYRPKCHQRVCAAAGSIHLIQLNMHEPPKPQTDLKRCYLCPFYARKWRRLSHSEEKGVKSTNKLVGNKRNFFLHLNSTSWRVPKIKVYTFVVVSLESVPHTLNLDQLYELTADFSFFFLLGLVLFFSYSDPSSSSVLSRNTLSLMLSDRQGKWESLENGFEEPVLACGLFMGFADIMKTRISAALTFWL